MYTNIYIYLSIYIYIYIYTHTHIYIYIYIYRYARVPVPQVVANLSPASRRGFHRRATNPLHFAILLRGNHLSNTTCLTHDLLQVTNNAANSSSRIRQEMS